MKCLLTGSSGLLGKHLKLQAVRPAHNELDITKITETWGSPNKDIDLLVHCAAFTDVQKAEEIGYGRDECFDVNVKGTLNLLQAYPNTPFVYISSEYAHNPVNFYSLTKSLAEQLVTYHSAPYLIIRTLFKKKPWEYEYAFKDKFTLGDYVDVIASKIDKEIAEWDRKSSKLIYVGTGRKSYFELAKETKIDVKPNSIRDVTGVKIPPDYR